MDGYFGLIPAAGTGMRMGTALPKQYLEIAGRPMIYYAVRALAASSRITRVFVVLSAQDTHWEHFDWSEFGDKLVVLRCGGATRAASVGNGLAEMRVAERDWVLVHDAARPCLTGALVDRLLDSVGDDAVGGLLAIPLADTLKRGGSENRVSSTEPRDGLWQAQTPQMFRHGLLSQALDSTATAASAPTDEASAMEALGHAPLLVKADASNFKVTFPNDLSMADSIIERIRLQLMLDQSGILLND